MKSVLLAIIKSYQKSAPIIKTLTRPILITKSRCRFYPTCSEYCYQAIEKYGTLKGLSMCIGRLTRCHPWNKGGLDQIVD